MLRNLKFLLAKALRRLSPAALRSCEVDPSSRALGGSQLTDVSMGRYSYCGYNCRITETEIGSFCSISDQVMIGGGEHPIHFVSSSPVFHSGRNIMRRNFSAHAHDRGGRTKIGNDVWIGYGAMIRAGVVIGDGAVIGMGSVVTRNVPPYSIWAGNPAREIRRRFDDDTIEKLLQSQWWCMSDEELQVAAREFGNVNSFLVGRGHK